MTATMPNVDKSGRYSPTQTARLLEISRPTLYARSREGLIAHKAFQYVNKRYYTGAEILRYWRTWG